MHGRDLVKPVRPAPMRIGAGVRQGYKPHLILPAGTKGVTTHNAVPQPPAASRQPRRRAPRAARGPGAAAQSKVG
jgi:hypothetical protein